VGLQPLTLICIYFPSLRHCRYRRTEAPRIFTKSFSRLSETKRKKVDDNVVDAAESGGKEGREGRRERGLPGRTESHPDDPLLVPGAPCVIVIVPRFGCWEWIYGQYGGAGLRPARRMDARAGRRADGRTDGRTDALAGCLAGPDPVVATGYAVSVLVEHGRNASKPG
jgi:hypothetical protein